MHKAAGKGHAEALKTLLEAGSNIKARDSILKWTALHEAASYGHAEAIKVLLDAGANPKARALTGETPLT